MFKEPARHAQFAVTVDSGEATMNITITEAQGLGRVCFGADAKPWRSKTRESLLGERVRMSTPKTVGASTLNRRA